MNKLKRFFGWMMTMALVLTLVQLPAKDSFAATPVKTVDLKIDYDSINLNTDYNESEVDARMQEEKNVSINSEGFNVNHEWCGLYYLASGGNLRIAGFDYKVRTKRNYYMEVQLDPKDGYTVDNSIIEKSKKAREEDKVLTLGELGSGLKVKVNGAATTDGFLHVKFSNTGEVYHITLYLKMNVKKGSQPINEPDPQVVSKLNINYNPDKINFKNGEYHKTIQSQLSAAVTIPTQNVLKGEIYLETMEKNNGTFEFVYCDDEAKADTSTKYYVSYAFNTTDEDYYPWDSEVLASSGYTSLKSFSSFAVYVNGQKRTDGYLLYDPLYNGITIYLPYIPESSGEGGNGGAGYSNEWVNGKWYNADGTQTYKGTLQWKSDATGWWVQDTDGWYPTSQWQKIDGKWYYFCADGYMDYSEYRDGCWLGSDGAWVESYYGGHWESDATGWWYADASGWYPVSQYVWIDGVNYWFGATGYWE